MGVLVFDSVFLLRSLAAERNVILIVRREFKIENYFILLRVYAIISDVKFVVFTETLTERNRK
jgi:hypothetical protein